ncbi:ATP-binding cassette domain-containing protein [Pseudosporangium ferrugineum]|uniref:ATP-binding cassette subfamily B protein n=1 Tax=Pseudosporangium ferrugineum TaxID=439699 RepID=A0A2T0RFG7_9ACTN|nr:ABC transporter ATP-binding protein [Pseudosporangium ferrugineum]PRY19882.1 ATP-binding cassette subfamily B protein [Pseudosporangium ferrugineum]
MSHLKATFALIRRAPGWFALSAVLQIMRSVFPLVPALVVSIAFDRLAEGSGLNEGMWVLFAVLIGAVLGRVGSLFGSVAVDGWTDSTTGGLLIRNTVARVFRRPGAEALPHSTGSTVNRLTTDSQTVADMMVSTMVVVGSTAQALFALGVMASVDVVLTVLVVVPVFAAGLLITFTSKQIKRHYARSREAAGEVSSMLREVFRAVQAIKLADGVDRVTDRVRELSETRRARTLKSRLFSQVMLGAVFNSTSGLGAGLVMLLAVSRLRDGTLTVGGIVLFVSYLVWITEFTTLFSQSLAEYKQAAVSMTRLDEVVDDGAGLAALVAAPTSRSAVAAVSRDTSPVGPLTQLSARQLTYRHPGSDRGIEGVDLDVRRGELVVVTGGVGAGKTTLLRVLIGALDRDAGTIEWNGVEVDRPSEVLIPPRCAYTPQVPYLMTGSVRDNITAGVDVTEADIERAAYLSVLDADLATMPDGLATRVGPRGTTLSGGQAQRVAAAQMLVRNPDLLVFDDISSALDVNTERELWHRLRADGTRTCLAVSHREIALAQADRVVVLRDGKVVASGRYEDIRDSVPELSHADPTDLVDNLVSGQ